MADVNRGNRPLSPFMIGPYYRPQITSISSIFIRITGIAMLLSALMIVWWFLAAATSPEYFATADWVLTSWLGELVLFLSLWAISFHLLGGLRHLYFDTGRGLELETAKKLGWAMFVGSFVLTMLFLILVLI